MGFDVDLDVRAPLERLETIGPDARAALKKRLAPIAADMAADAKARAQAHIRFLGMKPGAYVASITGGVSENESRVLGYVRSGSPLAHLLEYGAQTPPHVIGAAVGEALKFNGRAGTVFAARVNHPGAVIPAYPAIHPAFEARKGQIDGAVAAALVETADRIF